MSARSTTPRCIDSKWVRSEQAAIPFTIAVGTPQLATAEVTGLKPTIISRNTSASDITNPTTLERESVDAKSPIAAAAPAKRSEPR